MDLQGRLKVYEGTKQYQEELGYFKNNKFYAYKDSLWYKQTPNRLNQMIEVLMNK